MRVLVTGLGIVSPLGVGADPTMERLCRGERAFRPVSLFDTEGQRSRIAAEVTGIAVADVAPEGEREHWSRTDAMALVAAREALESANVVPGRTIVDLVLGGTSGGLFETERLLAEMHRHPENLRPMERMLSHPLSATADRLQSAAGPFRRATTICSACSSGANALLLAAAWIRSGRSRRVLAGGADGLSLLTFTGFNALAATDPNPCRPFDERRAGLTLGEGAAFVLLEAEEAARERGATGIVELAGWASASEAHHIANPEQEGTTAARTISRALARAGLSAADLDYVNAHGTGTQLNDLMETRALETALGEHVRRIPVSSIKGQIGHTLGAAGAIEAAVSVLAIVRAEVPPTGGLEHPDPACALRHVVGASRTGPVRASLSNSFGFGGTDTVLVFRRLDEGAPPRDGVAVGRGIVITGAATIGPQGVADSRGASAYVEPGPQPTGPSVPFEAGSHLDLPRARKMDRGARMMTAAFAKALEQACEVKGTTAFEPLSACLKLGSGETRAAVGAVVGTAYASVDPSAQFVQRVFEKGPRLASPAAFPNLVPSSVAAHAGIYLALRGVVLTVFDLASSAESAIGVAWELLRAGEADAMLAGAIEEHSLIVERVLGPVCAGAGTWRTQRTEGSSAVVLETAESAELRHARPLARVLWFFCGRDARVLPLPPPSGATPAVLVARSAEPGIVGLDRTPWGAASRYQTAMRAGSHEGLGGFAVAAAADMFARGMHDEALILGSAPDRWSALILGAP